MTYTQFLCPCMLPTFSFSALNVLLIVILHSLFDNSKICLIQFWFWYLLSVFSLCFFVSFSMSQGFCSKLGIMYQVIETEVNRLLVWTFMLIWLRIGLWLMFVVALGVRGSRFVLCLSFSSFGFRLPNYSSSKREYVLQLF